MKANLSINGEAVAASQEGLLVIELFLNDNYRFRRNVLNGKVEFMTLPEGNDAGWRTLTQEVQKEYPLVPNTRSTRIHIGLAMKECGYELTKRGNRPYYKVIPLRAA